MEIKKNYKEASIIPLCVTQYRIFPAVFKGIIFHLHFISMRIVSFYYKDGDFIFAILSVFLSIDILAFIREVITMCLENRRKSSVSSPEYGP